MASEVNEKIQLCLDALSDIHSISNTIINEIQTSNQSFIFIAKQKNIEGYGQVWEYWAIHPHSITTVNDAQGRQIELTISGKGIHGIQNVGEINWPMDYNGSDTIFFEYSSGITLNYNGPWPAVLITAKDALTLNSVKFEDDPDILATITLEDIYEYIRRAEGINIYDIVMN